MHDTKKRERFPSVKKQMQLCIWCDERTDVHFVLLDYTNNTAC